MDAKEDIRAKLDIEDVISEYVELKRSGRNFKGLSPFTSEKTPSFMVSPDKQIWHDFSSGQGGDIFSFIMLAEGIDFRQSLEFLARKAGIDLSQYHQSASSRQAAEKKQRLRQILELATHYFQHSMVKNKHALQYIFEDRALTKETVTEFQIGYAPSAQRGLVDFLKRRHHTVADIKAAGLLNQYDGDLFRGRMTVPLMDGAGQTIGFTARLLADEPSAPKYINTPQTVLYDKSRHVFGLSQAKQAIRTSGIAVLVEGNMDVVSSHQAGVKNVVATAGTALTEFHLKAIRRLTPIVCLAFDGDKAGLAATERAIPIAQAAGVELRVVSLPEQAKDPDELIQQSPQRWQQAIDSAQPVMDWVLAHYQQQHDVTTAKGKRELSDQAIALLRQLNDPVEVDHYLHDIASITATPIDVIRNKFTSASQSQTPAHYKPVAQQPPIATVDTTQYQDNLLALACCDVQVQAQFEPDTVALFTGEQRQRLAQYIVENRGVAIQTLPKKLQKDEIYGKIVLFTAEERYESWDSRDRLYESGRLLRRMENEHKKIKQYELLEKLRRAEEDGQQDTVRQLRTEINTLIKEINNAKR